MGFVELFAFAIGVSQASVIIPLATVSPEAAYALRSPYQSQHYSHNSNDPSARISNLQLLSRVFEPDLTNKKSKKHNGYRAMLYEPMLPLVEREPPMLPLVEKELPMLPLVERDPEPQFLLSPSYNSIENEDISDNLSSENQLPSYNTIENEDISEDLSSEIQLPSYNTIENEDLNDDHSSEIQLTSYNTIKNEDLSDDLNSEIQLSSYNTIQNEDLSDDFSAEKPKLNELICYDDNDCRQSNKHLKSSVDSFELESIKPGRVARTVSLRTVSSEASGDRVFERLKVVCAHLPNPLGGPRLSKDYMRLRKVLTRLRNDNSYLGNDYSPGSNLVPGLMWVLCKMLLKETGYLSKDNDDLKMDRF